MKIGIIGAGAMGSIFTYFFRNLNEDIIILEKDGDILNSLKEGLTIKYKEDIQKIPARVTLKAEDLSDSDLIFIFVKSYHTDPLMKKIHEKVKGDPIYVSLQNGLGNFEAISRYIPDHRIVFGTTTIGASKETTNIVKFGGMGSITIGSMNPTAADTVLSFFKRAKLDTTVTKNPLGAIWKKVIINAGINPIAAILSIPNGKIIGTKETKELQEIIIREAVLVANKRGMMIDADEMILLTQEVCKNTCSNICSMNQDIRNQKKTEIESITGKIIKYGKEAGVETPYNDALYKLIRGKEDSLL